jgi:monofunctional biosynthetic peptidoglycan transglycosylase
VVQAGGVILTLLAASRNRPQALALRAKHARGVLRRLGRVALWVIGGFTVGSVLLVALYRYVPPPGTPLMLLRRVEGYGIHKSWSSFDHLSANLVRAVIASEDTRFCSHHGFDWNAIEVAWNRYQRKRGRLLGASTISMQTAKNVFLWPGRDWVRKGFEAYFTVLIELAWSKQRIMEIYLNVVEWGPGIYGVEAAAEHYFHKTAAALSVSEAVRLAAVLPNPLEWSPLRPTRRILARTAAINSNMPGVSAALSPLCRRKGVQG